MLHLRFPCSSDDPARVRGVAHRSQSWLAHLNSEAVQSAGHPGRAEAAVLRRPRRLRRPDRAQRAERQSRAGVQSHRRRLAEGVNVQVPPALRVQLTDRQRALGEQLVPQPQRVLAETVRRQTGRASRRLRVRQLGCRRWDSCVRKTKIRSRG